jgi:hypothetical protein
MEELIEALKIFLKYKNNKYPTHCEHDILIVVDISKDEISQEDRDRLGELGFRWSSEYGAWSSFRYGSA